MALFFIGSMIGSGQNCMTKLNHPSLKVLYVIIVINIITTIFHYTHNVIHFDHYPEPTWLNARVVDLFWFIMTPFALVAGWLYHKGRRYVGWIVLLLYVLMSLLVLGHYNYAPFLSISFTIHLFIWLEVVAAVWLLAYSTWLTWYLKKLA